MDNLLILQCDQENTLKKMEERIYNMKLLINLPDGDKDFAIKKSKWRDELNNIEKKKI
jgi:hypothetical protein